MARENHIFWKNESTIFFNAGLDKGYEAGSPAESRFSAHTIEGIPRLDCATRKPNLKFRRKVCGPTDRTLDSPRDARPCFCTLIAP
jgi:hypothetical protein